MDPTNVVVKMCAEGMAAEAIGRSDEARSLFAEAWAVSANDYEACIAAHYLARHQADGEETLWWNQEALRRADAANDHPVAELYPSLFLNVAYALEQLGRRDEAHRHYALAELRLRDLPASGYTDMIRMGVARGQERTRSPES
jgi:Flp pilus assembly protein TadD